MGKAELLALIKDDGAAQCAKQQHLQPGEGVAMPG